MVKGLCRKFNALLRKEAVHENEPQRILFLLRIILLILGLYFLHSPLTITGAAFPTSVQYNNIALFITKMQPFL